MEQDCQNLINQHHSKLIFLQGKVIKIRDIFDEL